MWDIEGDIDIRFSCELLLSVSYQINIVNKFFFSIFELFVLSGYPRYCTATTLPDGTTVLNGGRSRRGKPRGPPGSRELQTALKGCDDPLFLDFIRRCLEWDPATRMTPNAALRHAWLRRRLPRPPQVFGENRAWAKKGGLTDWTGKSVSGNSLLIGI